MSDDKNEITVWSYLRFITPVLITISLFMIGSMMAQMSKMDDKIFQHLTNEEIHAPRSFYVTKSEFDLINRVRESQFMKIETGISELRAIALEQIKVGNNGK